jgi:hypothetical protein
MKTNLEAREERRRFDPEGFFSGFSVPLDSSPSAEVAAAGSLSPEGCMPLITTV